MLREKQKSVRRKMKSRLKRQSYLSNRGSGMTLQDHVQTEGQLIPKFVELCVKYLEAEGWLLFDARASLTLFRSNNINVCLPRFIN